MKIEATNLRGVGKWKSLDISQNTCFVGKNGTGKSTMLNVPYYVLTGKGIGGCVYAWKRHDFTSQNAEWDNNPIQWVRGYGACAGKRTRFAQKRQRRSCRTF